MNDKKTLLIIGDQKNYINLDDVAEFGIGEVRDVPIAEFRNIIMADNFNVDNTVFIKGFAETEDYIRPILSLNKKLNNADKPAAPGSAAAGKKPRRTDWLTLCILLWNPNRPSEKPVIVTDAGIIPDPNLTQKKAITKNAIAFARNIGLSENPIVNFMTISSSTDQNVKSSRDTEKLEKWLARAEPGARATHYADDPILSEAARRNKNIDDFTAPDIIVCHYIEQAQAEY
ncbi:MAG: phosphate acyltransferase, partial [Proteobacteria bacterium]|nr:phosphate acyltransferase [Pseudomonadota bacterium]